MGHDMTQPSWSTVTFVKDTAENVQRFVSYHLGLGANHMQLFFDVPDDPCIQMLAPIERVLAVACDPVFWRAQLGKEVISSHGRRQNAATTFGYHRAQEDWVLNLDADEFLNLGNGTVPEFLGRFPSDVNVVRLRPAERVLVDDLEEREFYRLPLDKRDVIEVHGEFGNLFKRRSGFFGHLDGKSFIRSGQDELTLRQHWPEMSRSKPVTDLDLTATAGLCVLHRNAEDYKTWRSKLDFRLNTNSIAGRLRGALTELRDAGDEKALLEAYGNLFRLSAVQLEKMTERERVFALDRRLNRFVSRYF